MMLLYDFNSIKYYLDEYEIACDRQVVIINITISKAL